MVAILGERVGDVEVLEHQFLKGSKRSVRRGDHANDARRFEFDVAAWAFDFDDAAFSVVAEGRELGDEGSRPAPRSSPLDSIAPSVQPKACDEYRQQEKDEIHIPIVPPTSSRLKSAPIDARPSTVRVQRERPIPTRQRLASENPER